MTKTFKEYYFERDIVTEEVFHVELDKPTEVSTLSRSLAKKGAKIKKLGVRKIEVSGIDDEDIIVQCADKNGVGVSINLEEKRFMKSDLYDINSSKWQNVEQSAIKEITAKGKEIIYFSTDLYAVYEANIDISMLVHRPKKKIKIIRSKDFLILKRMFGDD